MIPVSIPRPRAFEVDAAAGGRAIEAWESHNATELIELDCRVPANGTFHAREVNLRLEQVSLARVLGTPHEVARDSAVIAARPADAIVVYVALRGDALATFGSHSRVVHPGQLMICDVDKPLVRGFGHGLEEFAVRVPRPAYAELVGTGTIEAPIIVDIKNCPYAVALSRLVGRALSSTVPIAPEERAVVELVSVLVTGTVAGVPHAHRAAARAFIDDNCADPSLSAADVASGAGISERHLSRVFADAGTSVPRQILARRLDLAYSLLSHTDAATTADVAARSGFTSMAYFSQTFKRRFGVTAGDVRRSRDTPSDETPPLVQS